MNASGYVHSEFGDKASAEQLEIITRTSSFRKAPPLGNVSVTQQIASPVATSKGLIMLIVRVSLVTDLNRGIPRQHLKEEKMVKIDRDAYSAQHSPADSPIPTQNGTIGDDVYDGDISSSSSLGSAPCFFWSLPHAAYTEDASSRVTSAVSAPLNSRLSCQSRKYYL